MTGEQLKQGYNNVFINNEKQSKSIQEILDSIEHSKLYFSVDDQATMVIFEAAKNKESPELRTAGMNALYECIHRYILNLVTKKYESFGNWMEDMINEAYIAILENITDYNPSKGKPTTYFELIIKNQMNQFISKNILHTTPHYARIDRRIWNAMMALESQGIKVNAVNIQRICKDMTLEQIMSSQERLDQMKEEYIPEKMPLIKVGNNQDIFISDVRQERDGLYFNYNNNGEKTEILLGTYSLKFMKKSGRISAAAAFAGELMGLKPIIVMDHGDTTVVQKVRGDKLVIPALIKQFKERTNDPKHYIIGYTDEEYGKELYSACEKELGVPPMLAIELGSAVATNAGNHSIGIMYYTGE